MHAMDFVKRTIVNGEFFVELVPRQVLGNKNDLPSALSVDDLIEKMYPTPPPNANPAQLSSTPHDLCARTPPDASTSLPRHGLPASTACRALQAARSQGAEGGHRT
jgi:hypothetical protein